jgi:hypothetical protein
MREAPSSRSWPAPIVILELIIGPPTIDRPSREPFARVATLRAIGERGGEG